MLEDNKALHAGWLLSEYFAIEEHRKIFDAMERLWVEKKEINTLSLSEKLKDLGCLESVGGPAYLMTLDLAVPLASHAQDYADIITECAMASGRKTEANSLTRDNFRKALDKTISPLRSALIELALLAKKTNPGRVEEILSTLEADLGVH